MGIRVVRGLGGWVDGHIADGAQKEELWECPKLSERQARSRCQAQVTGYSFPLLQQVFEPVLCVLFCSGGSQAGWELTLEPRPLPSLWPSGPSLPLGLVLSLPYPSWHLGLSRAQVYLPPAALYTKGGAHGVPFYSCCLGVQGPTPASILEGDTLLGATHGTKPLPPFVGPVLAEAS